MNYYNEFDPYAAQWLRNLIDAGHLPKGEVDSRSIKDVKASELAGFVQCHFFAGLGGWSHALRLAGWPEDRPVWTGSCPCQPFSAAGAGGGVTDERHLWPTWFNLIRECRPDVIFGEQVEAAINHGWLDLVQADLEGEGYACGAVGLPAGGVGAPHIRQRLWFVGHTKNNGLQGGALRNNGESANGITQTSVPGQLAYSAAQRPEEHDSDEVGRVSEQRGPAGVVADTTSNGHNDPTRSSNIRQVEQRTGRAKESEVCEQLTASSFTTYGQLADDHGDGRLSRGTIRPNGEEHDVEHGSPTHQLADTDGTRSAAGVSKPNAGGKGGAEVVYHGGGGESGAGQRSETFWSDCDWIPCRDGKARPVEPGTFPLAHGVSGRVGRLRAYGNAIVPQVAQVFIEAYLES